MATKKSSTFDSHFLGARCRRMKPTQKHRPAVWENMLGTVYALNDAGECKYFDFKYEEALAFAGVNPKDAAVRDSRLHRVTLDRRRSYVRSGCAEGNPQLGKLVLWVRKL